MLDPVELAKALMQIPSVTPHDHGCQALIQDYLAPLGFHNETLQFDDVTNLWARIGTGNPLFVFAGHTDVVPPGPLEDWHSPPFQPELRDGYLYGRGASDMKCAIAAMMIAVSHFLKDHKKFEGSIAFLITSDEEGRAINGTKQVLNTLQKRNEKIDFCIVGEPSSESKVGDQLRVGRRGSLHGKVIIHGKQGHVAHPHLALNPIHKSMAALASFANKKWDNGTADFPPTTLQITNIHGGTGATNVIPGHLEVTFNFRFSDAITVLDLQKQTEAIFKEHDLKYDISWEIGAHSFLSKKEKLLDVTQAAIDEVCGYKAKTSTGGGTSDARFIVEGGTEVVELGLTHATAHHVNECIKEEDLRLLTSIYLQILNKLFC